MATQEDRKMMSWTDYFARAMQPPQLPQKPQYTQKSPTNDFGYSLGQAVGAALFGERYPTAEPNAGINTDLSQAQSNAYMNDKVQSVVPQNSALGQAMQQYGTGFEPQPTFEQKYDINNIASQMGNTAWNNATAADAANNQYRFNQNQIYNDAIKKITNPFKWR